MMRTPSVLAVVLALAAPAHATPIPNDPFAAPVPTFVGAPATPRSVPAPAVPQHPFMAPNGRSNIHDDAYQTDTYVGLGPLGRTPRSSPRSRTPSAVAHLRLRRPGRHRL